MGGFVVTSPQPEEGLMQGLYQITMQLLERVQNDEMNSLSQAAEAGALAFTECTCVQISTLALIIAKRIGQSQTEATLRLGEEGFSRMAHEIKIWISQLPSSCVLKIYNADVWPHRRRNSQEGETQICLAIHVPGTPTGADSLTWAIYQVLSELGEILTRYGFNTNDIGTLYDNGKLPHLGILLRFPWSAEMKSHFAAYGAEVEAIQRLESSASRANTEDLRERASSMWDTL